MPGLTTTDLIFSRYGYQALPILRSPVITLPVPLMVSVAVEAS